MRRRYTARGYQATLAHPHHHSRATKIMNRRLHTLTAWLLPFLCVRALLPVGFMPMVTEAGWQIVMCNGGSYQFAAQYYSAAADHVDHHAHHHAHHAANQQSDHSTDHSGSHETASDGQCLFALSAASAPIPFIAATDFGSYVEQGPVRVSHEPQVSRALVRAQQSRAPPFYS